MNCVGVTVVNVPDVNGSLDAINNILGNNFASQDVTLHDKTSKGGGGSISQKQG